jgi:maleate isomerase
MPPRRCAVIVPGGNIVHAEEFATLQPPGATFRFIAFTIPDMAARSACTDLARALCAPLQAAASWGADMVLLGCTTASMSCSAPEFWRAQESTSRCPIVTAAGAVCCALSALEVGRISVATPYGEGGNAIITHFLEQNGFAVTAIGGLGFDRNAAAWAAGVRDFTAAQLLAFASTLDSADAQALFLPCTAFRSLDAIDAFEQHTGKPVITSVQAGYRACMVKLGLDASKNGYGRLLHQPTP